MKQHQRRWLQIAAALTLCLSACGDNSSFFPDAGAGDAAPRSDARAPMPPDFSFNWEIGTLPDAAADQALPPDLTVDITVDSAPSDTTVDSGSPVDTTVDSTVDAGLPPDSTVDSGQVVGTGGSGGPTGSTFVGLQYGSLVYNTAWYVPPSYSGAPTAMVIHFHGWRPLPAGVQSELNTVWKPTADQQGIIVVAPEGQPCPELNPSNPYGCFKEQEDGPFVQALVQYMGAQYNLNPNKIYISGHSGGGHFVSRHGLSHPNEYAGAVTFSSGCFTGSNQYYNWCDPLISLSQGASRKLPFVVVHHPNDQVVPYGWSVNLVNLVLAPGNHPAAAVDTFDGGSSGHSVDPAIIPAVYGWLSGHSL